MAKFNELILRVADSYVTEANYHSALIMEALLRLVIAITSMYFDHIRTMAILVASCEEIRQGRYDKDAQLIDRFSRSA
jgi:hypothetical protein